MSSDKQLTTSPQPESLGIFQAIGQTLASLVNILTITSRTASSTVHLVEKEVIILHTKQDINHAKVLSELDSLKPA